MSVEDNIQLIRRWFQEVWNENRIQAVYDLLAPNAIGRGQTGSQGEIHGPDDFVPFVKNIRAAFPEIHIEVEDAFGAGDRVVARWSATMKHGGDGLGMPATGKSVRITGTTIARILDGRIIEGWDNWDQLGMLEQIGAYSPPESVPLQKSA
jgi:steroid delta-isomerase-like uncharacterized protein